MVKHLLNIAIWTIIVFFLLSGEPKSLRASTSVDPINPIVETGQESQWNCWDWDDGTPDPCHHMLQAVSMVSTIDGWAVGYNGIILHWDGIEWRKFPSPTTEHLYSIDMVSANDGWAVGSGFILRWDGSRWFEFDTGPYLRSIQMLSPHNGWAIGNGIYHWDGQSWEQTSISGGSSISMLSPNDGWAVGYGGIIIHWDGTTWNTVNSPTTERLNSVQMVSVDNGWAVGANGTIIHWDGSSWQLADSPTTAWIYALEMITADDGWAVGFDGGSVILHWDGNTWTRVINSIGCPLMAVGAVADNDIWAVGEWGHIIHWDGTEWTDIVSPTDITLRSVDMVAEDVGWAVGWGSEILKWDGQDWTPVSGVGESFSVRMLSATDGWAVGQAIYHWNGTEWQDVYFGDDFLYAVAPLSANDVWAVGRQGLTLHWDGIAWNPVSVPTDQTLNGIDIIAGDDAWAVGDAGTILHWDGNTWTLADSPTTGRLYSVDMLSATDGWAVGEAGTLLHWDGTSWQTQISGTGSYLYSIRMNSTDDGWITGSHGVILHWDGSNWTEMESPNTNPLYDIDVLPSGKGWIVGSGSSILYYTPLKTWTLIYYLAADNNLGGSLAQQYTDLRLASANPDVNIVALSDAPETDTRYLVFSPEEGTSQSQGELSTGDPNTLQDFMQWVKSNYPALNYALIIFDHGHGQTGIAYDEDVPDDASLDCRGKDCLTFNDLREALLSVAPVDVIYANACLMGTIEAAYQLRDITDYYVASEQVSWGPISHRPFINQINNSTTEGELAFLIAGNYYRTVSQGLPGTVSIGDMSEIENVTEKTSGLAGLLRQNMENNGALLTSVKQNVQHFDSTGDSIINAAEDEIIDLYHFAQLIKEGSDETAVQEAAQQVMQAIDNYIVTPGYYPGWNGTVEEDGQIYVWDHSNSHGLAAFFPNSFRSFYTGDWLNFASGTNWPGGQSQRPSELEQSIEWGPLLVEYMQFAEPNAPNDPNPPELVSIRNFLGPVYLPVVFR